MGNATEMIYPDGSKIKQAFDIAGRLKVFTNKRNQQTLYSLKFVPGLLLAFLLFFYCNETPQSYYPTLEDAIKDGAVDRDWIPEILPSSSREITEKHDIDTNIVWIKFSADKSDLKDLLKQLRILSKKEIDDLFPFKHPKKWWVPKDNNRNSFTIASYDYKFCRADGKTEDMIGYFFIDLKNSVAYYYSPPM